MHGRARERRQRDERRGDVRRLGVVDVEHAVHARDLLQAVLDAGERAQRLAHRVAVDPARQRDRRRGRGVGAVVRPAQADVGVGDERLAVPPQMPGAVVELAAGPERHAPRAAAEVLDGDPGGRDRDVVVALAGEDLQLGGEVVLQRAVAVEVVGLDVEQYRALGREGQRVLELKRARLADDGGVARRSPPRSPVSAVPTLPATATGSPASRWICPSSSTVVVLPFVPVTATNALGTRRQPSSSSPSTGTPRARAAAMTGASRGTPGDFTTARACGQQRQPVAADVRLDVARARRRRAAVDRDDPLAARLQRPRRGDPRAREPDDEPRSRRQRRARCGH